MTRKSTITQVARGLLATGLVATLAACGGGGGGGSSSDDSSSSSNPIVSRGVITQLGSIYVNGCRYVETAGGKYSNDDNPSASFDDYQVGMNVSIKGSKQTGTTECEADEVEYEAEVEGAADANGRINGITIQQTDDTNAPGIPAQLAQGTRYEVSGSWINDTTIEATFIKLDDDSGVNGDGIDEIKGFVESVDFPGSSFVVRGITFNNYSGAPVLAKDDYVEVHFNNCNGNPLNCALTGDGVELEDDFFDQAEGLEVEIEGAVELNVAGCAGFVIDTTCIDYTTKPAVFMDGLDSELDLVQGSRVEAEGHMVSGVLVADKVKGRANRVRVSSYASDRTGTQASGSFKLVKANITVAVNSATEYDNTTFDSFDATPTTTTRLEVRGLRTGANSMLALEIKVEDDDDPKTDEHEVRAEVAVGGADENAETIKVMNITSTTNGSTQLELDNDIPFVGTVKQFLTMIDDNDNPADGPRDIVEVRIDTTSGFYAEQIELEEMDD